MIKLGMLWDCTINWSKRPKMERFMSVQNHVSLSWSIFLDQLITLRRILVDNWRSSLENSSNIPKSVTLTKVWSFLLNLVDIWDCFLVCLWTKCLTWLHHFSKKSKQFWNSIEWFWQNNTMKITFWCQGLFYPRNFFIILGTFWC